MSYLSRHFRLCWLTLTLGGLGVTLPSSAATLDELRKLVESGQFDAAYKSAKTTPSDIGSPHFDFFYGLAAIGAGHVPEGLLALERHLSVVPANDRARLELALGYFLLGEYGRARTEFEFVLKQTPPKSVQANIQRYLDAMQTRDGSAMRASSKLFVDMGWGQDSNVNGGTYNTTINLASGTIPINNTSALSTQDSYRQMTVGGQLVKRVSPQLAVFAGGDFDWRINNHEQAFNLDNYGAFVGFSYLKGSGMYRVTLSDSRMVVNGAPYRSMISLGTEAQFTIAKGRTLTGFAQYGEASYADTNRVRDAQMLTLGGTVQQAFEDVAMRPSIGLQLSMTQETNKRMRTDMSRKIQNTRVFAGLSPIDRLGINVGMNWQQQQFEYPDFAFGTVRNDNMTSADISGNYVINPMWSLRTEWQVSDNQSNQSLYAFTRHAWALKVRADF